MSSALTPAPGSGSGGVNMQMDIGGLVSLMGNGAHGLKCLAMAGVDPHTLGAMLMISETCSAAAPYRRHLNTCRTAQRDERMWLYKVVELGGATNFVADELLKTRAGENVIALLSTFLPMVEYENCAAIIAELFETCKIAEDHTPGLAQLRRLQYALQPLLVRTKFKDRLLLYHKWFSDYALDWEKQKKARNRSLTREQDLAYARSKGFGGQAIPNESTMARVIYLLYKLQQENLSTTLVYNGIAGAAWVFAYCIDVLGLPTCVLTTRIRPVALHGDPETARVFMYICALSDNDSPGRCELKHAGEIDDFLKIGTFDAERIPAWSVDASEIRMTDLLSPGISASPLVSAHLAACLTQQLVDFICSTNLLGENFHLLDEDSGLQSHQKYCQPEIHRKAARILIMWGFDSKGLELHTTCPSEWSQNLDDWLVCYSSKREVCRLPKPTSKLLGMLRHSESLKATIGIEGLVHATKPSLTEAGELWLYAVFKAVEFAGTLAFTNWGQSIQRISTSFINRDTYGSSHKVFMPYGLVEIIMDRGSQFMNYQRLQIESLCDECLRMVFGEGKDVSRRRVLQPRRAGSVIAELIRGVIVLNTHAIFQRIDLKGDYITFMPGEIRASEEKRTFVESKVFMPDEDDELEDLPFAVYPEYAGKDCQPGSQEAKTTSHVRRPTSLPMKSEDLESHQGSERPKQVPSHDPKQAIRPRNLLQDFVIRPEITLTGDTIELDLLLVVDNKVVAAISPSRIAFSMNWLYITEECEHSYYDPSTLRSLPSNQYVTSWQQGLAIRRRDAISRDWERAKNYINLRGMVKIFVQAVDGNPAGQWVACQWTPNDYQIRVLQRRSCLDCAASAVARSGLLPEKGDSEFCIINGRFPRES